MQLTKLSARLKPLTVVAGIFSTTGSFAYSDIDNHSGITSTSGRIAEYIKTVDKSDTEYLFLKSKFQLHLQKWEQETMFASSIYSIVENEHFKAIVAMGKPIVPYIKEELENKPSTLVWALNYIYGKKISSRPNLKVSEACKLWIKEI